MDVADQELLALTLQVNLVQNPTKYLGMNFVLRGNRCADFQFLIDKLQSKLQGWKARLLSQAGRTTLISSVLQSLPLYTFACFKVPESICNKMDSIIRAFWWGHETREKKLHLLSWESVCQPKRFGGLGFKSFKIMNQALLNKQFWKITQKPQSLLSRTFKAKYFPRDSLLDCCPKPHYSWVWRNIIKQNHPILREGTWWVGDGYNTPLQHKNWFPCPSLYLQDHRLPTGTVGDLIDHNSTSWNHDLVRSLYPHPVAKQILQTPISKTKAISDKLVWRHSYDGEYKVRIAYKLLSSEHLPLPQQVPRNQEVWYRIWKVKTPLKVNTFVWKLLHDCIPTFSNLKQRGISIDPTCPFGNEHEETITHLFLLCPFSRACWHGSTLAIHSSNFNNVSIQQWLSIIISNHNCKDLGSMTYLQSLFTTLWTIWNHRNQVVHEGISHDPMKVILMVQTLSCRYSNAFSDQQNSNLLSSRSKPPTQSAAGPWQLIIIVAGFRNKKKNRRAYVYEAVNIQGDCMFFGVNSSLARTAPGVLLEAVVEAGLIAENHGQHHVLFLSDCRGLVKVLNSGRVSDGQDNIRLADINSLVLNGFLCKLILVPHVLCQSLCNVARQATIMPIKLCWLNPALL